MHCNLHDRAKAVRADRLSLSPCLASSTHLNSPKRSIAARRLKLTRERIRWKDKYGDDVGMSNFGLLMLEVDQKAAYIVAEPRSCLSYNKWGRPNPPYVVFKFQGGDWKRIALQELPARFKTPNLIMSSPDDEAKQAGGGLITAEMVNQINNKGPFSAAYPQPPQYKTILREPLKPGSPGVNCPDYSSPRYTSPKAPFPIKSAPNNIPDSK